MDQRFYKSLEGDLAYNKTIWGLQRLNIAYYISMILGSFNILSEFLTKRIFENIQYKLILFCVYGVFIMINKKLNSNISLVKYVSFALGEVLNWVLIYFAYIEEPECALVWIQLATFVVIFYQSYLLIGVRSIILFSIKHSIEWAFAGIYFSSINMNNIAPFLSGILALPVFIFACTYFEYLQDIDLCFSKKKSEMAVNKIDALVESISDNIFVLNSEITAVFMNSASKLLLKNKLISEFFQELEYHIRYEGRSIRNNLLVDIKSSFSQPIGTNLNLGVTEKNSVFIEWSGKIVIWENRLALILFGKNVTKLVKLEKENRENQYKSVLLRTVSHELRTPTNAMLAMTQLLKETCQNTKENNERLDLMTSSCTYLLCLINDLLDYSQIMAGSLKISKISFAVKQLFSECLKLIEVQLIGSCINLELYYTNYVPENLISDPYRLKQIVLNLLGNARKFTIRGMIALHVTYSMNRLEISCKDTGVGIPSDRIKELFAEFGKISDSNNLNPQGVGLGLYISNMLTFELGGNGIKVTSEVGKGSIFTFFIEAKEPSISAILCEIPEENSSINFPQYDIRKIKERREILIVDDTYFNVLAYMQILKQDGYKVGFVNNGKEAIEQIRKKEFLCILMDCEMPVLDGWETTKILRKMVKNHEIKSLPPIIGCTAHNSDIIKYKCLEAGMDDYLLKPCPREAILKKIQDLIQ